MKHEIELAKRADQSLSAAEDVLRDVIRHAATMAAASRANFSVAFGEQNKKSDSKAPWSCDSR